MHAGSATDSAPLSELLRRKPAVSPQIFLNRLDQLASQVVGQSCVLHLGNYLSDIWCAFAKDRRGINTQVVFQGCVQVSILSYVFDGPGKTSSYLWRRDGLLIGRYAQCDSFREGSPLLWWQSLLPLDEGSRCPWIVLDHSLGELWVEGSVFQDGRTTLLADPLAGQLTAGVSNGAEAVLDLRGGCSELASDGADLLSAVRRPP